MDEFTECSVCFENFDTNLRKPYLLYCTHSFCELCLKELTKQIPYKCPTCREEFNVEFNKLHKNRQILRELEKNKQSEPPEPDINVDCEYSMSYWKKEDGNSIFYKYGNKWFEITNENKLHANFVEVDRCNTRKIVVVYDDSRRMYVKLDGNCGKWALNDIDPRNCGENIKNCFVNGSFSDERFIKVINRCPWQVNVDITDNGLRGLRKDEVYEVNQYNKRTQYTARVISEGRDVTIVLHNANDPDQIKIYEIYNEGIKIGDEFRINIGDNGW